MATATEQLRAEVAQAKSYGGIRLRLDIEVPIALLDEALAEMDLEREKYARALAAKDEGLDALRADRDALRGEVAALKAADECQVDGVPPCSDKGQPLSEWCRSCLCSQAGVDRARAEKAEAERDEWKAMSARSAEVFGARVGRVEAELDALRGDAEAYAKTLAYLSTVGAKGHDVSGDAQQGIASLVEQRDAERARADSAERELAAVLENFDVASLNKALDEVRAERDAQRAATFEAIDRHQQAHAQAEFFKGEMQALRTERDALRARISTAVQVLHDGHQQATVGEKRESVIEEALSILRSEDM